MDINERMDDEDDSADDILAAICNAELHEFNCKKKNASEEDPDPEGEQFPMEISNEINDLQQVSHALRYIIDAVIQKNESTLDNKEVISAAWDDSQKSNDQNSNEMMVDNNSSSSSSSSTIVQPNSNSSSNSTATEAREYSIQPKLFGQFSAVDKAFLQMDAGICFVSSKSSHQSDRIALCHFENQPIPAEEYWLENVFGTVTVSSFSFQDSLRSSYDCFRREEEGNLECISFIPSAILNTFIYQLLYGRI